MYHLITIMVQNAENIFLPFHQKQLRSYGFIWFPWVLAPYVPLLDNYYFCIIFQFSTFYNVAWNLKCTKASAEVFNQKKWRSFSFLPILLNPRTRQNSFKEMQQRQRFFTDKFWYGYSCGTATTRATDIKNTV